MEPGAQLPSTEPRHAVAEHFSALFPGRTDVWGALHGQAVKEQVTLNHYRRHLEGQTSLGIYPLRPDGLVRWLAVDIDQPDPDLPLAVMDALYGLGINRGVYLERSKSKDYHVPILLSDWTPAVDIRRIARAAVSRAGLHTKTEIFPKQDRLTPETPYGNYLNLPYFGGDNPEGRRMVLNPRDLTPVPLKAWLETVETFPTGSLPLVLDALPREPEASQRQGHPTSEVVDMLSATLAPGSRRPTLVSLAGYLRYRGVAEEVAVALLLPWAQQHFDPHCQMSRWRSTSEEFIGAMALAMGGVEPRSR